VLSSFTFYFCLFLWVACFNNINQRKAKIRFKKHGKPLPTPLFLIFAQEAGNKTAPKIFATANIKNKCLFC